MSVLAGFFPTVNLGGNPRTTRCPIFGVRRASRLCSVRSVGAATWGKATC